MTYLLYIMLPITYINCFHMLLVFLEYYELEWREIAHSMYRIAIAAV